ncbi:RHS repeat-associated core domain-containing protein [Pseudomonas sp. RC10]|uniref:RHS repeat-associated core domain-containing protein n=1 Tax=Pseudomonas bambusae TaxID=3139142 RepID=UPI0031387C7C
MAYTLHDIEKYLKDGETIILNGVEYVYRGADRDNIRVTVPDNQNAGDVDYLNYKQVKTLVEVDVRRCEETTLLRLLLDAGGVEIAKPDRSSVATVSRPLLIETSRGDYFFGEEKEVDFRGKKDFSGDSAYFLYLSPTESSRKAYDSLLALLPQLKIARFVDKRDNERVKDANEFLLDEVEHLYDLQDVDLIDLASALDTVAAADEADAEAAQAEAPKAEAAKAEAPKAEAPATDQAVADTSVQRQTLESLDVPYLITTQPDGYLPDMTDFTLAHEGSVDDGWYSTVPIKGDRALTVGETLSAFLVNRRDGEISRVDWKAPKGTLERDKWPASFAQHIASQEAASITAGAWGADNTFSTETKTDAPPLRLWSHAKNRAFTNAPFAANLIQVLACNEEFPLIAGQTLCLQVRDLKTQALFEQHFFQMADQAKAGWSKPLCEQINRDSRLLRAGVLNDDCQVVPTDRDNAFWGPQCAELSVTLTLANWWQSREVEGTQALDKGTTLHAWVFDAFSHRLLAQHEWTPSTAQRGHGKWLAAWANAVNASEVSPYLRASIAPPSDKNLDVSQTNSLGLWHRGDGLRIFTSLPDTESESVGRALELPQGAETTDDVQVTVRHPFSGQALHKAVFTPEANGVSQSDQKAWRAALITFLKDQAWPELQFVNPTQGNADVRMPRFCELQIELDPVDIDVVPAAIGATPPTVTTVPGSGSFQVIASAHTGEIVFRLSRSAFDEGMRIAACVPVALGEDVEWPVSVTGDRITWGARTTSCTYQVTLDCPEKIIAEKDQRASEEETIVGHLGVFSENQFWQVSQPVTYTPPGALTPYEPISVLCEDYGNTERSEIFDTLGQGESGVDPRTGLFHAHYPVATLQGLNGLGPICDLTLHYSALRGNEAGLGDGWAWRFSSLDVRERCLTLANGVRITFTLDEWKTLSKGTPLKKQHCLVRSNKDYSEFILDLPSGRREVLSKPGVAGSDAEEPNAAFVDKIITALKAIKEKSKPTFPSVPSHWTQWVLAVLSPKAYHIGATLDYNEAVSAWEKHGSTQELDERIAYYQRPFVQLVPSRIVSLYGEALDLEWKRQKGQFLLMGIKSGKESLFTAQYPNPVPIQGDTHVNMQVWPDSTERFEVNLQLRHCLLRKLTRTQENPKDKTKQILQQVDCGYVDDPTLDRVLCRLTELDGSVECVQYRSSKLGKGRPLWPQAVLHALIPGDGHENQLTTYRYSGRLLNTYDQLYIVEGERGAHGAREHHLQVFGLDERTQRQELILGSASIDSQWLEFKARQPAKEETTQETEDKDKDGKPIVKVIPPQPARSEVLRYTGYGDDLIQAIDQIKLEIRDDKVVVTWADEKVDYQQEIVDILWRYGRRGRTRLIRSIQTLMQVLPASQRPALGKGIDRLITKENDDGLPVELIALGQHTCHYAYYPVEGGDNIVSAKALNELVGVFAMPQLNCPKLPEHAVPPLMAEYQYDDCGHSLGLKLFGYRAVERDGRTLLELDRQVVIEGIGVKGDFAGQLSSSTEWVKTADEVLWRERMTSVSAVTNKATPSGESKVRQWTLGDKQVAHFGKESFTLETTRTCEDNPTQTSIVVRTVSKTQAGSQPISAERCSRYSQRCVARIEDGIETTWAYDAAGRVVDEAQYWLKPGANSKEAGQKAQAHTRTQYSDNGKRATQFHANGDASLAYLDGLQRTWRSEWRRADALVYLPLFECVLQGLDESQVMGGFEWDYLPGGQAVVERGQVQLQEGRRAWGSEESIESAHYKSENLSRVSAEQEQQEICYEGFNELDNAERYFIHLNELHLSKAKTDEYVRGRISDLLPHTLILFKNIDVLKALKFLQGLAGRKGIQCLQAYIYDDDVSVHLLDESVFSATVDDLISMPDMENVDPSDYRVFLKDKSGESASPMLRLRRSNLFTSPNTVSDVSTRLISEQGLYHQRLFQRTTEYLTKTDGTFERTQTLADGAGLQQLKLIQHLDSNARVVSSERVVGDETRKYAFERDALGRVTKITRPDGSLVERTYHGFSNQITELKVGGKVVATQKLVNDSTLKSRKVGSRTYTFDDDTVTLPDKTRLHTQVDAEGVKWDASDSTMASLTRKGGITTVASGTAANDTWRHSFTSSSLPGRLKETQTTPRGESNNVEWQSLRGVTVAMLRADGHWQRGFVDHDGRVLRTCQEHEDVAYRFDSLGRLQSRQVQALKAGEQWQVLSAHDGFGQEVTRTFLHNGAPRFEQRMAWRGDGRLASKASYEGNVLRSTERFSYDILDRLERYTCEASEAAHCPKDAEGNPVKAQVFTWDALDNLVSCVTTAFDGSEATRAFKYENSKDPTRMTAVQRGATSQALSWSDNGYLNATETKGRTFAYNVCGQVSKVSDGQEVLARYEYDGYQRLAAQYVQKDDTTRELRYDGDELIGEIWFDKDRVVTRRTSLSAGLAEYDGDQVRWLIDDPQVGVAGQVKDGDVSLAPLLPFGEGVALDEVIVGYNGLRRDPVTGQYHAGNGYRSYDPTLCRYAQPDWLAPVGEGGINPYQHCPDPVNLHDPSGAIMLSRWEQNLDLQNLDQELKNTQAMEVGGKWRGLALSLVLTVLGVVATVFSGGTAAVWLFAALTALSVVSFGLEVASVLTAESNPALSRALGVASMVTGVLSASCFLGAIKAGVAVLKQTIRLAARAAVRVWSGAKMLGKSAAQLFKNKGVVIQSLKGLRAKVSPGQLLKSFKGKTQPFRREGPLADYAFSQLGNPQTRMARSWGQQVLDYVNAPAAELKPMPTYERYGWLGKLRSAWDGPDPLKLTGRPARFYAWANQSRFVSKVSEIGGLAMEANILRGTGESSYALAQGDDSSTISVHFRARYRSDNPYKPREATPRYDLWAALGLSG